MDGGRRKSMLWRLLASAALTVLTFGLVASVMLDRAARPEILPCAIEQATRDRVLRLVDERISEALSQGDEEAAGALEEMRRSIIGAPVRYLGAR